MQPAPLSLLELNLHIKELIKENTRKNYWVVAEISELKVNNSGHCYLELVQKDTATDQIVARSRATIWAQTFRMIKPYFETTTGQPLAEGLGILVKVAVEFHEVYGLSLNITDIEPTYTVGELVIRKQKIIERLTGEGVIGMNKEIGLPVPCHKIAVISSVTAAGYEDFTNQLINNSFGFKFYLRLFPAVMQGEDSEKSIIAALDKVYQYESFFDCVIIIRGGGSQADLSCFNSYWLAYYITQFPLPVLTGIGHEQDDSVVDMVAHTRLKTPTAVAAFLVDSMASLSDNLNETSDRILSSMQDIILQRKSSLILLTKSFRFAVKNNVISAGNLIIKFKHVFSDHVRRHVHHMELMMDRLSSRLEINCRTLFKTEQNSIQTNLNLLKRSSSRLLVFRKQMLEAFGKQLHALDPFLVLNRGYSITYLDGMVVKDAEILNEGDILETRLNKGKIRTTVNKKLS
jgi:exodeoxyribonuclease VII large subunit